MQFPWLAKPIVALGARVEVFGPWRANVYAGYALAVLFVTLGVGTFVWGVSQVLELPRAPAPEARKAAVGNFVIGLLCLLLLLPAAAFGYLARSFSGTRLEVHEHGFVWRFCGSATVLWSDVARIEERFVPNRGAEELLDVIGLLLPPAVTREVVIVHRDGRQFTFDRETVHRLGRLKKRLKLIAAPRGITWAVESGE